MKDLTPEEDRQRRALSHQRFAEETALASKVNEDLNEAIRKNIEENTEANRERVRFCQLKACEYYGVPHGDWLASQVR
jgi:hypothetical protein